MIDRSLVPARLLIAAGLLLAVITLGTVGYVYLERWSWFDALYMTITTLSTVGGGEPRALSTSARWLTLAVIVVGVGVMTYTLLALVAYLLEGQLGIAFGTGKVRRQVARLNNHFILCGFGRVGREIVNEFIAEKVPFVIVDVNQESLEKASRAGHLVVTGNPAEVEVLKAAGIERARGLVTAVDADADNIFVTLSARALKPDIFIVARANQADSQPKLRLAGANRIISPYSIGGKRMANLAMRPTAVEFVDTVLSSANNELLLEDLTVSSSSPWAGKRLNALIDNSSEIIILAMKRNDVMTFRPPLDTELRAGDEIVVAGSPNVMHDLEAKL